MRTHSIASLAARLAALAFVLALVAAPVTAATITIVNLDGADEGFNDPTPAAPVGGNPGTTIGEQRLYVFQYAANIWGHLLPSPIEILVESNFDPLDCDSVSAVLGSAGPNALYSDFPNAPFPMTWYHEALANKLSGVDQDPATADISAQFNSGLGSPGCFPYPWYYGVDGNEGSQAVELLPVVLHELGHGLGFSTSTLAGVEEVLPHVYDHFLLDNTQGMHWNEMTEGQRVASAQNCNHLVWDGPTATQEAQNRLGPKPVLRVNNSSVAGDYDVGLAAFGPALTVGGVTGDLALALDGMGVPTNGCEPITTDLTGKIALIDRGGCFFVDKVKHAMEKGAIAVVICDSTAGCPAAPLGGADPTITIPAVRITQDDGARIKSQLLMGVNATLRLDPSLRAGADPQGHPMVYTPVPYQLGSSISHWDVSATPDLLMEPALNLGLSRDPDMTPAQFKDIGWFNGSATAVDATHARTSLRPSFPNPATTGATISYTLARPEPVSLAVYDAAGRLVSRLVDARIGEGSHSVRWNGDGLDGRPLPAGVYHYRLKTPSIDLGRHLVLVR